jgi:hypothetical protein
MLWFLLLTPILVPIILAIVFPHKIKLPEIGAGILFSVLLIAGVYTLGENQSLSDTEILNGGVIGKDVNRFSCPTNTLNPCRNGYTCNCRTVRYTSTCTSTSRVGNRTVTSSRPCTKTRTECDTCYRYPWEQNWMVSTSVHQTQLEIPRVDPQGAQTPPFWEKTRVGDPASRTNTYDNYIKAAANSLFNEDGEILERYKNMIPEYPLAIHDYFKYDRVVTVNGASLPGEAELNELLSKALVSLGAKKQVNVIVVFAEKLPAEYMFAVRRAWEGFNKNDVVVFIGTESGNVVWADAMSWSKSSLVNVTIRDEILNNFKGGKVENVKLVNLLSDAITKHYERRQMVEFEYLKSEIQISTGLLTFLWLFSILGTAVMCWLFYKYDPFGLEPVNYGNIKWRR